MNGQVETTRPRSAGVLDRWRKLLGGAGSK
jgi:hypothetical protein